MHKVVIALFYIVMAGCSIPDAELKKGFWKLCDGDIAVPKDVLKLDDNTLRNDTVFYNVEPIAVVISKEKRIDNSNIMLLKWIETGDTSRFCQK